MKLQYISSTAPHYMTDDYLAHHGILGMKWGVRRFQNKDGSYTKAGLKRYEKARDQRDKLVSDAEGRARGSEQNAKEYKKNYDTLKKEGAKGQTMRKMYGDDIDDDKSFTEMYGMSVKDAFKAELDYNKSKEKSAREGKKAYEKYAEKVKNMDISDLSHKDVTKKGKELLNEAWAEVENEKKKK